MPARRSTVILLSMLLGDTACARLFPATKQDNHPSRGAQATVEKTPSRRREGSDVTLPSTPDRNWPARILAPCDADSTAAAGNECQRPRVDTLRAPIDTATKTRP
jgi:hypothetical protein